MIYSSGASTAVVLADLRVRCPLLSSSPVSGQLLGILQNPIHLSRPFPKSFPTSPAEGVAALGAPTFLLLISRLARSCCVTCVWAPLHPPSDRTLQVKVDSSRILVPPEISMVPETGEVLQKGAMDQPRIG